MASVGFRDRRDAGRQLGAVLAAGGHRNPVVLGLPRGGVVVAAEVAAALDAPLDIVIVRKLGTPGHPELAAGALGEDGVVAWNPGVSRLDPSALDAVVAAEREELARRRELYRAGRPRVPVRGRTAIVVDDGVATGATAAAACRVLRAEEAAGVVLAVPVAPRGWERVLGDAADEYVAAWTPRHLLGVGRAYADFTQVTDDEVLAILDQAGAR